ncbi:2-polyprenyl-6-methoxyphenol hydroxylase [Geodermatophilus dictyosporus]|uniref:2-polyprenyl-6-methoxyphenol hydroxylase n=1 Tax=Geodermatophilus dictyosporus TaxID=1523247 RepID=A0A1I5JGY7_9ACTN|nr:FAD-dependent monooxygenase [Geodermatophilus dictyosporus]SFO72067.1 2-polyprenyl-6-methoxyphenol hydroxylase [Geodermatophilus dictyosporus]
MTRAIVVGGGVAGPVAAMALQKVGIAATVHEARAAPAGDVGAWLGVQVNGLDALRAVDAEDAVRAVGFPTPVIEFRNHTGRVLGTLPTGSPASGRTSGLSLRRSDLYRALHGEARRRGIEVRHGSRLTAVSDTGDGVTAVFADGRTETADLLVGADGVRSTVRGLVDPDCPPPRFVPVLNTAGYSEHTPASAEVGRLTMVFGRRAFAGYLAAPAGGTWWFANPPLAREPSAEEVAGTSDAEWRARLADLYGRDRSPVAALVEATPGPLRGWTTYDVPTVRRWSRGRTVLIGDAAHATSPAAGQGSSLAIEDAVVLARCLRDLSPEQALRAFEGLRRARAERVVAQGFRTSSAKSPPAVGRLVRDLVVPLVLRHRDPQAWVRDHAVDWGAPVPVPAG